MTDITIPSFKVELANSLSHALGVLFGVVGIPVLIATAVSQQNPLAVIAVLIYGFCFLFIFSASTAYHSVTHPDIKKTLRTLDHIGIYFQIAGSYTPFILLFANETRGIVLLTILWGATLLGIVFKVFFTDRFEWLSLSIYILMGWSILILPQTFFDQISGLVLQLIIVGGIAYTVGVGFYVWKSLTYHHAIWHLFVLIGSICHFGAVWVALLL